MFDPCPIGLIFFNFTRRLRLTRLQNRLYDRHGPCRWPLGRVPSQSRRAMGCARGRFRRKGERAARVDWIVRREPLSRGKILESR